MKQHSIRAILENNPVIPVVTFKSMSEVDSMIEKLLSLDIHCIEITLRTEIAMDAILYVKETYGHQISVGMGTVTSIAHIEKAVEMNIDFMVSPGLNPALFQAFEQSKIAFIPGVVTPSEIMVGLEQGWDTFKFFPATIFGGIDTLKAYSAVFPSVKFCPTGGIQKETFEQYLTLPNVISVGGSWMIG